VQCVEGSYREDTTVSYLLSSAYTTFGKAGIIPSAEKD